MAQRRPDDAIAALREWLTLTKAEENTQPSREDLYSAYILSQRYRLLAAASTAAGQRGAAERVESKRRELVAWWKGKLTGRNDAELFLSQ
jgi:hypothetical protein